MGVFGRRIACRRPSGYGASAMQASDDVRVSSSPVTTDTGSSPRSRPTAHHVSVSEELNERPIIEQDATRVTHREDPNQLASIGRDLERVVRARAVARHLDDRVIIHGNRTIVF